MLILQRQIRDDNKIMALARAVSLEKYIHKSMLVTSIKKKFINRLRSFREYRSRDKKCIQRLVLIWVNINTIRLQGVTTEQQTSFYCKKYMVI